MVENLKDHNQIPDNLGIGIHEERDSTGQLFIYFHFNPSRYVVLGRYLESKRGPYYVADYTRDGPWMVDGKQGEAITKHEHLLMAVARIHEIKDNYERRIK